MPPAEIPADKLRRRLDTAALGFESTEQVSPLLGAIHQTRAMAALEFGVGIDSRGYNLFVTGLTGSGRTSMARAFLDQVAAGKPVPDDWIYIHNFEQPDRPIALNLPAGQGKVFAGEMDTFVDQARQQIVRAFETERYAERRQQVADQMAHKRDGLLGQLETYARKRSFGINMTPNGIVAVPLNQGQPFKAEQVSGLTKSEKATIERHGREVQAEVGLIMRRLNQLDVEGSDLVSDLDREIANLAIEPLLQGLRDKYQTHPGLTAHLGRIAADVPNHLATLRASIKAEDSDSGQPVQAGAAGDVANRYRVNVVVDNSAQAGAPVAIETNPTYYNLIGRTEYRATLGTLVTDFRQIKPGALLRANGGYLILDAADVLSNPFAWPAFIRALTNQEVRIENLSEQQSMLPTASLAPMPIPLQIKAVLVGSPGLYQSLFGLEEEFRELFKVRVDFTPEVDWNDESVTAYSGFIRRCIDDRGLMHFDASAVARVIEETARWRDSQRKLSTRLRDMDDLVTEASYWAKRANRALVTLGDVEKAISDKSQRSSLAEERLRDLITDGTIRVETSGNRIGQLNGLSVIELGDHRFGVPSRISATVAVGRGRLESIERETELGGPIHNKGFLIVSGYLSGQYAQEWPLALHGTLTFEQSYEGVDGDSASSAELYALLSALAEAPLKQSIAVTGSVDQHGNVQAIGGVNDKIEGFFKVCQAKGLTGDQGVLLPVANLADLMLSDEVVAATKAGTFHIWAVNSVDEGIEILTGVPAGELAADGSYAEGTIHRRVAERLRGYAAHQAAFANRIDGDLKT